MQINYQKFFFFHLNLIDFEQNINQKQLIIFLIQLHSFFNKAFINIIITKDLYFRQVEDKQQQILMNGISLSFKVDKFEKQFNKDRTKSGRDFSKGYLLILLIEMIVIGIDYAINRKYNDLIILCITLAQFLLGLMQRLVVLKICSSYFNLFIAIQNLGQAMLNCCMISFWLNVNDIDYVNNLYYGSNIVLKHIYLLQGSNFIMKFITAINIGIIYEVFFIRFQTSIRHYVLSVSIAIFLQIYKIFQEDLSLRNLFLVQRSEDEMNFLVKRLLPVSMLITKYDKKEERIYFHMSNTKLQKQFHIKDDDSMKNFLLKVELQALDEYQRLQLESNNNKSLFQHMHFQAISYSKKHYKKKNTINVNNNQDNLQNDRKQSILNNNSIPNMHQNQQALFSAAALNQPVDDMVSPNSLSCRQSGDLISHRMTEHNLRNIFGIQEKIESDSMTQKIIKSIRKKEHKKTIKKQFDNLEIEIGDRQYEQTIKDVYNTNSNHPNSNNIINNLNINEYNQKKGINNNANVNAKNIADEIYDRLEVFYGILQGENQKILNIKIYTYILEEIYQVIIFEDETLQGRVEYLQKLNKYYMNLFEQMLKKLRAPIAQSLYKMKKAVNNLKQNIILKQQQSINQNLSRLDSILSQNDQQTNALSRLREIASDLIVRKQSSQIQNTIVQSTLNNDSSRQGTSLLEDIIKQDKQQKDLIFQNTQDLQYNNYNILNSLFNYQDIFKIFSKNSIIISPINISLERIIKDLKTIFQSEYKSRCLELYFINDLTEEDSYINTDEKYLKQVFINLINNSLQSLTKIQKGYTAVHFKLNPLDNQLIDISIIDTGPGFDNNYNISEQILIQHLNVMTLGRNLKVKELKVGIPISQKIIGKLGPYEKIQFEKNVVRFQIYKDYDGLIKNKDNNYYGGYVKRKSLFVRNKTISQSEKSEQICEENEQDYQQNEINYAIQKQQVIERSEALVFSKHQDYFSESSY
ncbi:ATPase, histidine kinase-, DNA gyrase B (macronuclear) [Tetrahymena thermophila SB210]|uniref:ATPase, histidine kinase-, DNA gyrase B n=1 Tax=Tetrahymena thermophila (strain SB210) TaxID=312017 RepID=I7M7T9_TETTS|nr:ATPase, histidine kinase-, DNA gyrase B [Tetrahymena thermophila SB210]EAR95983.2 ATPase, histidine kinase-, DNA gyrase B [Tetrahymena thermophila SB210]|eukprot:XP_001016228.2 ATPase, histidine kinase-, DNA gyrase B [Tetrahymena thermophila SB210]